MSIARARRHQQGAPDRAPCATPPAVLSPLFPAFESTGVVARRAEAKRAGLEASLSELQLDFSGAHDAEVGVRRAAYEAISAAMREAPASQHERLFTWWALSARVERVSADEALVALRVLDEQRVEPRVADLEAMWEARLTSLERESAVAQALLQLGRESFADEVRRQAKQREPTPAETKTRRALEDRLALFDEVTTHQGALAADVFVGVSGAALLKAQDDEALAEALGPAQRSLPLSGYWRTGLGGGVWRRPDGSAVAVVKLDEAGLLELLGEQRLRGIGAASGVRILEGSITVAPSVGPLPVVQSHVTLLAYDSLVAPVPPAPKWQEHVGFGFEVSTDYRSWRSQRVLSGAAGWALLAARGSGARHLMTVGVGPSLQVGEDPTGVMPMGGVTSRVVARLGLQHDWPSALRLEARHQSLWGPGRVLHEVRADVSLDWVLAWGGRPRLLVRPTTSITVEPTLGQLSVLGVVMLEPIESLAGVVRKEPSPEW